MTPVAAAHASGIAICVPARDEATRLPYLLDAVEALAVPAGTAVHVCILLDGCGDASAAVIDAHRPRSRHRIHVAVAPRSVPNAGLARHRAMALGLEALGQAGGILLSTDADSWPRADWLTAMTAALDRADVVVGDVRRRDAHGGSDQDRIDRYYAGLFALRRRIDPVTWEAPFTHHHASGANMGMSSAVYRRLGGFLPLASGEDARLVDDAARAGLRVRRDAASLVHTSARRHGRAAGGLADALHELDRHGLGSVMVAHPADQAWQYGMQALARRTWATRCYSLLQDAIGLDHDHLLGVARDCPDAEAFAMRVVPVPPGGMRQIGFVAAEALLAAMVRSGAEAA